MIAYDILRVATCRLAEDTVFVAVYIRIAIHLFPGHFLFLRNEMHVWADFLEGQIFRVFSHRCATKKNS